MTTKRLLLLPLSFLATSTNYSTTNDFTHAAYFGSGMVIGAAGLAAGQYVISKNPTTSAVTRGVVYGTIAGAGAAAVIMVPLIPLNFLTGIAIFGSVGSLYEDGINSVIKKDNPTQDVITTRKNDGYLAFVTTGMLTGAATSWLIAQAIAKKAGDSK